MTRRPRIGYKDVHAPSCSLGQMPLPTRSDFERAVKDALRHYTQADLLTGNALLHARLLMRSGPGAPTPQALRALLAGTAETLFTSERDQRVYRALDLTYFTANMEHSSRRRSRDRARATASKAVRFFSDSERR